jgi:transcriptional regulator with XRE-family HTH domain
MATQFGEKLRYVRRQRGLTQTFLATTLSTSLSYISNLEAGRRAPSLETVIRIADTLNITTDYLLRDTIPIDQPTTYLPSHSAETRPALSSFGAKLRFLRIRHEFLQAELAQRLRLRTQAHISLLETGRKQPSLDLVVQVADLFQITTDYFLRDSIPVD